MESMNFVERFRLYAVRVVPGRNAGVTRGRESTLWLTKLQYRLSAAKGLISAIALAECESGRGVRTGSIHLAAVGEPCAGLQHARAGFLALKRDRPLMAGAVPDPFRHAASGFAHSELVIAFAASP